MLEDSQPAATFPRTLLTNCQAFLEKTTGGSGKRPQRRRLDISPPELGRSSPSPTLPTSRTGEADAQSSRMPLHLPAPNRRRCKSPLSF